MLHGELKDPELDIIGHGPAGYEQHLRAAERGRICNPRPNGSGEAEDPVDAETGKARE